MTVRKSGGAAATVKKAAAKPSVADARQQTEPAKVDVLTPATEIEASGALIEPTIVERVDVDHPAVDNNPREGASVASNQIDFNDPTLTQEEAVVKNLGGAASADAADD